MPDKRYTFDFRRPVTPLEHMVADYESGPEPSRREHYEEWCRLVIDEESSGTAEEAASEEWVQRRARELEEAKYSIHMHVWTQAEFLRADPRPAASASAMPSTSKRRPAVGDRVHRRAAQGRGLPPPPAPPARRCRRPTAPAAPLLGSCEGAAPGRTLWPNCGR